MKKFDIHLASHLPYYYNDRHIIEDAFKAGYDAGQPKWIDVKR